MSEEEQDCGGQLLERAAFRIGEIAAEIEEELGAPADIVAAALDVVSGVYFETYLGGEERPQHKLLLQILRNAYWASTHNEKDELDFWRELRDAIVMDMDMGPDVLKH
jgi:hypothetical protein